MKEEKLYIGNIPAIVLGNKSNNVCLYIHGQGGNKYEAKPLSEVVNAFSCQMISIDLPGHGDRLTEMDYFDPWHIIPELSAVLKYIDGRWTTVTLFANSIGAWFSMLAFESKTFESALFVSPVLDMSNLISKMMMWASVSEEQLHRELVIPTSFGQTLSWEYLIFARENPITRWNTATQILYGENDNLTGFDIVNSFSEKYHCDVTVVKKGEHWFHTQEQMDILYGWTEKCFQDRSHHIKNHSTKVVSIER